MWDTDRMNPSLSRSGGSMPTPRFVMRGHTSNILAIAVGPKEFYSGSVNGELRAWDRKSYRCMTTIKAHTEPVAQVIPLEEGIVITQGRDATVRKWSTERSDSGDSKVPLEVLHTNSRAFGRGCLFSLREEAVVGSRTADEHESPSLEQDKVPSPPQPRYLSGLSLALKGQAGLSAAIDKESEGDIRKALPANTSMMAVPTDDGQMEVYDWRTAAVSHKLRTRERSGLCLEVACPCQGDPFLSGVCEDGRLYVWDIRATAEPLVAERIHEEPGMCLAFSSNGQSGVSGSAGSNLIKFNLNVASGTLTVVKTVKLPSKPGVAQVNIRADDRILVTGGWDRRARIFSWKTMKPLAILKFHNETVNCVASDHWLGSNCILTAGDSRLAVWELY